jgi:hypothetical protein
LLTTITVASGARSRTSAATASASSGGSSASTTTSDPDRASYDAAPIRFGLYAATAAATFRSSASRLAFPSSSSTSTTSA